jgi:hypothetical protein
MTVDKELPEQIKTPILALGFNDAEDQPQSTPWHSQIHDLECVDLRHVVDHLRLEYDKHGIPERTYIKKGDVNTIKSVRVNCAGDITIR